MSEWATQHTFKSGSFASLSSTLQARDFPHNLNGLSSYRKQKGSIQNDKQLITHKKDLRVQPLHDAFTTVLNAAERQARLEAMFSTLANHMQNAIEAWQAEKLITLERRAGEFNIKIAGRQVKFTFSSKLIAGTSIGKVTCWLDEEIPIKTLLKIGEFTFSGSGAVEGFVDPQSGQQLNIARDVGGVTIVLNLLIDAMSS